MFLQDLVSRFHHMEQRKHTKWPLDFFYERVLQILYPFLIADHVLILSCHIMGQTCLPLLNAVPCRTCPERDYGKRLWPRKSVTLIHSGDNNSVHIFSFALLSSEQFVKGEIFLYTLRMTNVYLHADNGEWRLNGQKFTS